MDEQFNTLNDSSRKPTEPVYAQVKRNLIDINEPPPPQYGIDNSQFLNDGNFTGNVLAAIVPTEPSTSSKNPFNEEVYKRPAPPPPPLRSIVQQESVQSVEEQTSPYWENTNSPVSEWDHQTSQEEQNEVEYYEYDVPSKRKGFSKKIDRLVKRFPALGAFYKLPPSLDEESNSVGRNPVLSFPPSAQLNRDLTVDESVLKSRYSNSTQTRSIHLQGNDEIQPVDLRVQRYNDLIYLCDVGRSIVEIFSLDGQRKHVIENAEMLSFKPTALAITDDGTLILCSHFQHSLQLYAPIADEQNSNQFRYKRYQVGSMGKGGAEFFNPAGICIDPTDGSVYICDRGNFRIKVLNPQGICYRILELVVHGKKKLYLEPSRLAYQSTLQQFVCIVNSGESLCFFSKYAKGRTFVIPFNICDSNGLGLENASGLAVDSFDRIFISDTGHNRIIVCTPAGEFLFSFASIGNGLGQLERPCGLDLTKDGTVVVTDSKNKRIQLFGVTTNEVNPVREDNNLSLMI